MLKFINEILLSFSSCFSRNAAFHWFCTVILGIMTRSDSLGITSFIRALGLKYSLYHSLEHFFHADSWDWAAILYKWLDTVASKAPLKRISGRAVLIGDGSKRASDGKYMPCIKKMAQESESASKPRFIYGHLFGAVGVLIGNTAKIFCLPLSMQIHDGDETISKWLGDESVSHTVQMLRDGFRAAGHFGKSLFVLDRYFLTVPLLSEWKEESVSRPGLLHIITRAKKNCTAYMQPGPYKGRGRHPLHGKSVHLRELFQAQAASFKTVELMMYGSRRKVSYLSCIYLWGQKLYLPLQFVLVEYEGKQVILVSTDTSMDAEDIIAAYAYRFKIEAMFRGFKHQFGGFCYHFWSSAVPKLDRYQKKGSPDPLCRVKSEPEKEKIIKALRATEGYVLFAGIAMGIVQMLCLKYGADIRESSYRYLRTPSKKVMSEGGMMEYLRRNLFRFMAANRELTITKIISNKQEPFEEEETDLLVS